MCVTIVLGESLFNNIDEGGRLVAWHYTMPNSKECVCLSARHCEHLFFNETEEMVAQIVSSTEKWKWRWERDYLKDWGELKRQVNRMKSQMDQ